MAHEETPPRRVFQIGAAGGVGRRLASRLTSQGHRVTGMHRRGGQDQVIRDAGATPVAGDLIEDSVASLAELMAGHDAVVFTAGAHGTGAHNTTAIDGRGLEKAAEAAAEAGVHRFALVSVFMDALRDQPHSEGFEHYVSVKRAADVYLAGTALDWLIVRPGTLTDRPGTGHVAAGAAIAYGEVSRDDVAAFLAASLLHPRLNRVVIELTSGNHPVDEAIAALEPRAWQP